MYLPLALIKYSLLAQCRLPMPHASTSTSLFNFELLPFIDFSSRLRLFWHLAFSLYWLLLLTAFDLFQALWNHFHSHIYIYIYIPSIETRERPIIDLLNNCKQNFFANAMKCFVKSDSSYIPMGHFGSLN